MIYYAIYYASLTHACYIVLFCHSSTEENQAQETDQSSDCITINDVVDINDQHYFNIFSMYSCKSQCHFLALDKGFFFQLKQHFLRNRLINQRQLLCVVFLKTHVQTNQNSCKNYDGPESMMPHTISLPVPEKKSQD